MRLLERVVEKPHPCAYLPGERASLEVRVMLDVTPPEMDALLERGWRRFGPIYFRPACAACAECVSLRVPAERFAPSKSQRRAARACGRLRRVVGRAARRRRAARPLRRVARRRARAPAAGSPTPRRASATRSSSRSRTPARARPRSTTTRRPTEPAPRRPGTLRRDAARPLGRVLLLRPGLRAPVARDGERPLAHRRRASRAAGRTCTSASASTGARRSATRPLPAARAPAWSRIRTAG